MKPWEETWGHSEAFDAIVAVGTRDGRQYWRDVATVEDTDAALIAAAPELYRALVGVLENAPTDGQTQGFEEWSVALSAARNALKKARGE